MTLATTVVSTFAPILYASRSPTTSPLTDPKTSSSLVLSPILSYADQILSMRQRRSSAGFSLDIPLIMLTASILKIFYWPGARFDASLLVQAWVMIAVQLVLLKVALDGRSRGAINRGLDEGRPGAFWRWSEESR